LIVGDLPTAIFSRPRSESFSQNGKATRMKLPDWRALGLDREILTEPITDGSRIVIWLPADRDSKFRYWQRVANVPRAEIKTEQGKCATAATSIRARERLGGVLHGLLRRIREPRGRRSFLLPNGRSVEQCGERQSDLALVWPQENGLGFEIDQLEALWPGATRVQKLGESLFLVSGVELSPARAGVTPERPPPSADCPTAEAQAILAAARQRGDREQEATALADLGVIALNEGDAKRAIASLENALVIARELGDATREADIIGNLGMAMLGVRQPDRARILFDRQLAQAQSGGDRFAEKVALERLGLSSWHLRDYSGALTLFDQALNLTRELGDRQQEATLLWHQAIQHAELGQREAATAKGDEAIALFKALGKPQAASYGSYLQRYRMNLFEDSPAQAASGVFDRSPHAYLGTSVASVMAGQSNAEPASATEMTGPGLLRMALSATKAMAGFAGSGFKTTPAETQRKRIETCAVCEHHTGLRCKICGCFTNVKSRMLHEDCPIGKWPA
jgi:tetratricopeptide (TPR) repeat protein